MGVCPIPDLNEAAASHPSSGSGILRSFRPPESKGRADAQCPPALRAGLLGEQGVKLGWLDAQSFYNPSARTLVNEKAPSASPVGPFSFLVRLLVRRSVPAAPVSF